MMNKNYLQNAIEKRDRIIAREGSGNGARLTDDYLNALVAEEQQKDLARAIFSGKGEK